MRMAEAICQLIETFHPDAILVIHKSGVVVWRAVERWWLLTRSDALPPVVGANLGPSKVWAYFREGYEWYHLEYSFYARTGHLVAWMLEQKEWQERLRARFTAVLGPTEPSKILIVDDVIADGRTTVLAQSLLWAIYPKARTPLVAGLPWDWRSTLGQAWLRELNPHPMPPVQKGWVDQDSQMLNKSGIRTNWDFPWPNLISGLCDTDWDPLGWSVLGKEHPLLIYLARYLPAEVWLQFPEWVATTTFRVLERAHQSGVNPLVGAEVNGRPWELTFGSLAIWHLMCALAWQQPWVSLVEAAARCNTTVEVIEDSLVWTMQEEEVIRVEVDGVAGYAIAPGVDPRVL